MKNGIILDLEQLFSRCKYTTLKSDESYKVFQNGRRLRIAAQSIRETIQELIKQDEPKTKEDGSIDLQDPQSQTFKDHYQELLNDETEVTLKRMHWEGFDAFCKENGFVGADINALADMLLIEEELNDQSE